METRTLDVFSFGGLEIENLMELISGCCFFASADFDNKNPRLIIRRRRKWQMLNHLKPFSDSSFRVIKFSSIKWKNNNTPFARLPQRAKVLISFRYFYRISKEDSNPHFCRFCLAFEIVNVKISEKNEEDKTLKAAAVWRDSRMISNEFPRDTYRDMLHDNGFYIMQCVFSQASTWTSNHITMIQSFC